MAARVQQLQARVIRGLRELPRCDRRAAQRAATRASQVWFCRAPLAPLLQADDLPAALHGLLKQAAQLLKPPSRGAAPAAPAAARQALVAGLLLTLERLALLAAQQRSPKLVKVRGLALIDCSGC